LGILLLVACCSPGWATNCQYKYISAALCHDDPAATNCLHSGIWKAKCELGAGSRYWTTWTYYENCDAEDADCSGRCVDPLFSKHNQLIGTIYSAEGCSPDHEEKTDCWYDYYHCGFDVIPDCDAVFGFGGVVPIVCGRACHYVDSCVAGDECFPFGCTACDDNDDCTCGDCNFNPPPNDSSGWCDCECGGGADTCDDTTGVCDIDCTSGDCENGWCKSDGDSDVRQEISQCFRTCDDPMDCDENNGYYCYGTYCQKTCNHSTGEPCDSTEDCVLYDPGPPTQIYVCATPGASRTEKCKDGGDVEECSTSYNDSPECDECSAGCQCGIDGDASCDDEETYPTYTDGMPPPPTLPVYGKYPCECESTADESVCDMNSQLWADCNSTDCEWCEGK